MDLRELPVDEIVLEPDLNLRDRLDPEAIERYADAFEDLPPVTVFEVDEQWLLADGFHRHAAFLARKRPTIPALIRRGSFAEALDYAAGANLAHGLPLRRQERRRALEVRLRLAPERSDRQHARELGVGRELVAKVRNDLVASGQIAALEGRVGADGKVYPAQSLPRDPLEGLPSRGDTPPERAPRDVDDRPDAPYSQGRPANGDRGHDPAPGSFEPEINPESGRDLARSGPINVEMPTIDEMLEMMARQVVEVASWVEGDDFDRAYADASPQSKQRFQTAVRMLSTVSERLDVKP